MNNIKAFLKDKGLYFLCLALVFAATAAGILAIRNVVSDLTGLLDTQPGQSEEDAAWEQPDAIANNPVTDLPKPTAEPQPASTPSAPPSSGSSSDGSSSASAGGSGSSGAPAASSVPSAVSPGLPVGGGRAAEPFSGDELVYQQTLGDWRTHNGADYAGEAGAPVYALCGGTVSAAYQDALWGGVLELTDAQGKVWRYCGLSVLQWERGATVPAGAVLGSIGQDSLPAEAHAGPHLHLECQQDGAYLDPAA